MGRSAIEGEHGERTKGKKREEGGGKTWRTVNRGKQGKEKAKKGLKKIKK